MKLYCDPVTANCRKVLAGFSLMSIPFEKSYIDYFGGGHKTPEFLEINPNASIPVLVDGDFILWESNAILQYAADKHAAFACYPRELRQRADIHRWQLWESAHWLPSCYVYLVENVGKPLMNAEPDYDAIEKEMPNWHKLATSSISGSPINAGCAEAPSRWPISPWPLRCIFALIRSFLWKRIPTFNAG
jgi:glutathione S-transferase